MGLSMKKKYLILGVALLSIAGCKKQTVLTPLPVEQIPATMETAFKQANTEAKAMSDEIIAAWQKQDAERAILQAQTLCAKTELTPEQRAAATRAWMSMQQQMQAAADKGDAYASEALRRIRATK